MALTIAVGFVVDDAIVMLENIFRHIEAGMEPLEAAIKGAGEIGFTIVSISASLIAVFIPLLLMGGIVGRLFREFAVTVSIAVVVSAIVSLTLTPMMCSRFLHHEEGAHGGVYRAVERMFELLIGFYRRTLDIALTHHFITLLTFFATVSLTVTLYAVIPKGFFPTQDNGLLIGISEAAQDVSFKEMVRLNQKIGEVLLADPDVVAYSGFVGAGSGGQPGNNGRYFITLKPFAERHTSAQRVIARLRPQLAKLEGAQLFLQAAQDVRVGARPTKTLYQFTLQDADAAELYQWAPKVFEKLSALPGLRDVATDQLNNGSTAMLTIDRDAAARFGIAPQAIDDTLYDALGQRQVTQYFTQINTYHLIMEVLPEQQQDLAVLDKLYVTSATGKAVPLSTFVKVDTTEDRAAVGQPPEPVSGGDDFLQSRARRGDRPGGGCDQCGDGRVANPDYAEQQLPGHGAGVPGGAGQPALSDRGGADGRLHHPGDFVRKLHPAVDHPLHPALGRAGGAADPVGFRL